MGGWERLAEHEWGMVVGYFRCFVGWWVEWGLAVSVGKRGIGARGMCQLVKGFAEDMVNRGKLCKVRVRRWVGMRGRSIWEVKDWETLGMESERFGGVEYHEEVWKDAKIVFGKDLWRVVDLRSSGVEVGMREVQKVRLKSDKEFVNCEG